MADQMKRNLREAYDRKASYRDKRTIQDWKVAARAHFLSLLPQAPERTLLEIGAGTGLDSHFFQEQGWAVTCIDLSPEMVRLCQQKGLTAFEMDVTELQFDPASFDAVFSMNCLLHLPSAEWPAALANIKRVLKPNGLFYLGVYGGYSHEGVWAEDRYEPRRFFTFQTDEGLKERVMRFFDVVSFEIIEFDGGESGLHFQSCILGKGSQQKIV